jgi:hypothetical protein
VTTRSDILFDADASVRYHKRRCAFLENANFALTAAVLVLGSGAVVALMTQLLPPTIGIVALAVGAAMGAVKLVYKPDHCAVKHADWTKRWTAILTEAKNTPNPSAAKLADWVPGKHAIEAECIGEMNALKADCWNRTRRAQDRLGKPYRLRWYHRSVHAHAAVREFLRGSGGRRMTSGGPAHKSVADALLYTTVRVSTYLGADPAGSGTAFFWRTPLPEGRETVSLITNRHVLEGADRVSVTCHVSDDETRPSPTGRFTNLNIMISGGGSIAHPNVSVDLVAIPIVPLIAAARSTGTHLFYVALSADDVPPEDHWPSFDSIEDVLMIGCPRGIFDEANNMPIARRGITATPLGNRYEGRDEFLIDMACFPGSSGSPVFIHNQLGFFDRRTGRFELGKGRAFLVGVLYAGPTISNSGEIVLSRTPSIQVATMMHLGQVMRSSLVRELDDHIRDLAAKPGVPHF